MKIDLPVLLALLAIMFALGYYVRGVIDSNYEQVAYYVRMGIYTVVGMLALMGIAAFAQGWRP